MAPLRNRSRSAADPENSRIRENEEVIDHGACRKKMPTGTVMCGALPQVA